MSDPSDFCSVCGTSMMATFHSHAPMTPDKTIEERLRDYANQSDFEGFVGDAVVVGRATLLVAADTIASLCRRVQAAEKVVEAARRAHDHHGTKDGADACVECYECGDDTMLWVALGDALAAYAALSEGSEKK